MGFGCVAWKGILSENDETKCGKRETVNYVNIDYCPNVDFFGRGVVVIYTMWCLLSVSLNKIAYV
jgi:hypothetical protein